jgi:hypothetical protein
MRFLALALEFIRRIFSLLDARTGIEQLKKVQAEEALAAERAARDKEREANHETSADPARPAVVERLRRGGF